MTATKTDWNAEFDTTVRPLLPFIDDTGPVVIGPQIRSNEPAPDPAFWTALALAFGMTFVIATLAYLGVLWIVDNILLKL